MQGIKIKIQNQIYFPINKTIKNNNLKNDIIVKQHLNLHINDGKLKAMNRQNII